MGNLSVINRTNFSTNSPFEPLRGYSRAVRVGDHLYISGTTAMNAKGDVFAPNEPYEQTRYVIGLVRQILEAAEFSLGDLVRTRLYVTNISKWEEYARAHREAFEHVRPASCIVQVTKLVDARMVIEMEAEARRGVSEVDTTKIVYHDIA